ncbi:CelD/BcsL family acetyltransferase involved in cellulose biosynthesis [Mycoplana sp. BE70]|uniref:GNAT family N-acetyltransferase n=1 Tax=Mycoplana sp. BE70 TaxID=2817775 RepID=UPI002858C5AB|nr:GNAT family N-acetyltransferase [Mycoplana sp. BE70]MDR6759583.1 CelD/BcsL family acetyltransferase involved in cellulose biosynthesis [Mycoplana sp. BE70]
MQLDFQVMPADGDVLGKLARYAPGAERRASVIPFTIQLHNRMEPLEATWRRLEAGNDLSLHQSYDWCRAWAQTHDSRLLIVEGVHAGRTELIMPLEIVRQGPVRTARFLGSRFSNINTGLYTESFRSLVSPAMLRRALDQARGQFSRHFDLFMLENMPLHWRGHEHPFSHLPAVLNQNAAYQLPLLADFDETLTQLNAKRRRKKFRQSERRLEALGGYEHLIAETPGDTGSTLDQFFQQKATRFEALGLPNVFRDDETQAFFRTLVRMPAKRDAYALQLHALRIKSGDEQGRIIAIAGLSRKGDHVICQFGSIDETFAPETSPGEFLFHLMIRKLCGEGVAVFDFGIGDQAYKRSWCTIETRQHDLLWPTTAAGSAIAALHRAKANVKRTIKQNPRLYGFVQRLRSGNTDFRENPVDGDPNDAEGKPL